MLIKKRSINDVEPDSKKANKKLSVKDDPLQEDEEIKMTFEQWKEELYDHNKSSSMYVTLISNRYYRDRYLIKLLLICIKSISNQLSRAEYQEQTKTFLVINRKGRYYESMGHTVGGKLYLHIEEAMYLASIGAMEIYYKDAPLVLQECYKLFETDYCNFPFSNYQVYSFLKKQGYHLLRYINASSNTNYNNSSNSSKSNKFIFTENERNRILKSLPKSVLTTTTTTTTTSLTNNNSYKQANIKFSRNWWNEMNDVSECSVNNEKQMVYVENKENECKQTSVDYHIAMQLEYQDNQHNNRNNKIANRYNKNKDNNFIILESKFNNNNSSNMNSNSSNPRFKMKSLVNIAGQLNNNQTLNSINRRLRIFSPLSMDKVNNINNNNKNNNNSNQQQCLTIDYNVYKPGSFKKTSPGKPDFRIIIKTFKEKVPDFKDIQRLLSLNDDQVPLRFCVVAMNDISFFSLEIKDILTLEYLLKTD
ncbi:hypothetical protein PPL_09157 [Heterostelium album PN500]|uniref:tRNA-splicing endonuclease subunit Sen54 N-terminal domain-containing protein n=1 Tax=Heterostelium pallidum (strain ATCC 26659 / Pp 5 / PN500) TaxID=670386 RepID=D3BKS5_HETP5|nr:hypothetical protein PPL_09157 [Heterostelium album PN500]EFA78505.1 hypothetical protein PPL_09157 [Heterostelium album PN500]|eukprot:XP_020430629.1 hypothetical protein PPL_09157 [Heterostelium album PN500]